MKTMAITGRAVKEERLWKRMLGAFRQEPPDYLEVRDKTAPDRSLLSRLQEAKQTLTGVLILANGRFDLALAAGADGVILPANGLPVAPVRRQTPRGFLIGKSTHSVAEVREAAGAEADLVILGPIFDTPAKRQFGAPLSTSTLDGFPEVTPGAPELLLIGGIRPGNIAQLLPFRSRFSGVAAIRMFEEADDPAAVVLQLRGL